jgi:predicted NAD/FAD-binding protein
METPVLVSLNPLGKIDPAKVIQTFDYDHPVFDSGAIAAQHALPSIQGDRTGDGVWFAGAWANYGFHEDGFQSGRTAAKAVLAELAGLK